MWDRHLLPTGRPHHEQDLEILALHWLLQFANDALQIEDAGAYTAKYHGHRLHPGPLRQVRDLIAAAEPGASELADLDKLIERVSSGWPSASQGEATQASRGTR